MLIHWIWLAECSGVSIRQKTILLETFGDAEDIFFAEKDDILGLEGIDPRGKEALLNKDLSGAEKIQNSCVEKGISICTIRDEEYPQRLMHIIDPPLVLYYKGTIPNMDEAPVLGVVGTRECTPYGSQVAKRMGYQIVACGGILVSGIADGIDGYAMQGALLAGGKVVGVLGNGADVVYPKVNKYLYADVERFGCLITEFPPETPPYGWNFPRRNRIISGLCNGVVVVEAPHRSGSLSTARHAGEQGRDVFVVPGNVDMATFDGSNALLRDGATPVRDGWDVVSEYEALYPDAVHPMNSESLPSALVTGERTAPKVAQNVKVPAANTPVDKKNKKKPIDKGSKPPYSDVKEILPKLTEEQRAIVELLTQERLVDEIVAETGIPAPRVSSALTVLQIKGIVKQLPGNRVVLK